MVVPLAVPLFSMVHVLPTLVARMTSPSTRPVSVSNDEIEISSIPKSFPEPPVLKDSFPFTIPKTAEVMVSLFPAYQSTVYLTQSQVVEVMAAKLLPSLTPLTVKYN